MFENSDLRSRGIDCTLYVMKTKALISCSAPLFFAYAKRRFSHEEAKIKFYETIGIFLTRFILTTIPFIASLKRY